MIKLLRIPAVIFAALSLSSCEWTEPEHIGYYRRTFQEDNPEGYEQYLESVREYKTTDHKVMIVTMNGTSSYPVLHSERPMSMPDSVDYINVNIDGVLHPEFVKEISEVRERKGTRVVNHLDFAKADVAWTKYKIATENHSPSDDECRGFFRSWAEEHLALCDTYGLDGVVVSFEDVTTSNEKKISMSAFIEAVSSWKSSHRNGLMMFRGNVNLIGNMELLAQSDYIIIVLDGATGNTVYQNKFKYVISRIGPKDRNVFEVTVPSLEEPKQIGDSPRTAAERILSDAVADYEYKGDIYRTLGIAVSNAHDDYFNDSLEMLGDNGEKALVYYGNYVNIRRAIEILANKER